MRKKRIIIAIVSGVIAIVLLTTAIVLYFSAKNNVNDNLDIFKLVSEIGRENVERTGSLVDIPVDFEGLWEVNTDIYAWLNIPGTNIDYPILQSDDNNYYLNHTWDKKEHKAGSIYTETYNTKTFDDVNTLIYGHRMWAGNMFYMIQNYEHADFFDENRYIYIYLPDKKFTYEIVASTPYSDEHILYNYDFENEDDFNLFFDDILSTKDVRAHFLEGFKPKFGEDKFVTLSTCLKGNGTKRYLLIGKLISVEE